MAETEGARAAWLYQCKTVGELHRREGRVGDIGIVRGHGGIFYHNGVGWIERAPIAVVSDQEGLDEWGLPE